jgi:phosphopantetheinyl transferase (holo-ACP synthase)
MSTPIVRVYENDNVSERPMTEEELKQFEADAKRASKYETALAAKEAAKVSAVAKLAALGLSEDEAKALLGV